MRDTKWRMRLLFRGCTLLNAAAIALFIGVMIAAAGCNTPSTQATAVQEQDKTLNDPMGYSPDVDRTDITGGGLGTYNDKAMKKDLDDVLNP